jgi:hypothetical protein
MQQRKAKIWETQEERVDKRGFRYELHSGEQLSLVAVDPERRGRLQINDMLKILRIQEGQTQTRIRPHN